MRCPRCGSTSLIRHGWQWRLDGEVAIGSIVKGKKVQRYRCNNCGRFTVYPVKEAR